MHHTRRLFALMLAAVLLVSACATDSTPSTASPDVSTNPGGGATQEPVASDGPILKVGYAPSTYDFTDFFGQFDAGLRAGLTDLGVSYDMLVQAPKDELQVEQQRSIIENMLALGVDYLVAVPTRLEAHYESFRLVNEANVPLIIGQFVVPIPEAEDVEVLRYAGASLANAGEVAAQFIIDTLGPGGKIIILSGQAGGAVDEGRVGVAIPILEAAGIEILAREYADFQRDLAYNLTEGLLSVHPDVDLIYGSSSAMALGALSAVEDAGIDVPVIGVGGVLEEVLAVLDGRLLATVFRDPAAMGRSAAEAIYLHASGREDEIEYIVEIDNIVLDSCKSIVENYNRLLFNVAGKEWPTC